MKLPVTKASLGIQVPSQRFDGNIHTMTWASMGGERLNWHWSSQALRRARHPAKGKEAQYKLAKLKVWSMRLWGKNPGCSQPPHCANVAKEEGSGPRLLQEAALKAKGSWLGA